MIHMDNDNNNNFLGCEQTQKCGNGSQNKIYKKMIVGGYYIHRHIIMKYFITKRAN